MIKEENKIQKKNKNKKKFLPQKKASFYLTSDKPKLIRNLLEFLVVVRFDKNEKETLCIYPTFVETTDNEIKEKGVKNEKEKKKT